MKISLNTIATVNKIYGSAGNPAPNGVDELVKQIGTQLGAVEEVIYFGKKLEGVVVAKIVECHDHENSDHLHVCKVDDGGKVENVERDEKGLVTVVCGAPNARQGITVAWLPPGSTVPDSYGTDEPFVLSARPLRGIVSNGMLASPRELALGDDHDGILEITEDIAPGTLFIDAFNLRDDAIVDIENKMFTHRPDCFGMLGVARELEGIQHRAYKSPEWYTLQPTFPGVEADELKLEVVNELPELVSRFMAMTMRDITIKPSPMWMRIYMAKMGIKSINNIVDYTNWFMLETGQPLHAYDYDKVMAQDAGADHATLVVRKPKEGEKIALLNGKEIEPRPEAIMIATRDKLIGVGGVMGGADTEVDENTKNIILECATFDMYSIRRTAMAHGLFTDAVTRNNKGQSPLQNAAVLAKIVDEIRKFADGKVASPVIDDNHLDAAVTSRGSLHPAVETTAEFVNTRLGFNLDAEAMAQLLRNVEFSVETEADKLVVTAPFWRTDIQIAEDVVEEIGRLYGFDRLPLALPKRDLTPAAKDKMLKLKSRIRRVLSAAGANEILSYSFVHGNLLQKVGQDPAQAFKLSNAISPDLQYYRLSLMPSLLDKVHANIKAGYDRFALFEMNKVHTVAKQDEEGLPREFNVVSLVFAANAKAAEEYAGAPYYQARKYLLHLLTELRVAGSVHFEPLKDADLKSDVWLEQLVAPYEPQRSAIIRDEKGIAWGVVGEFKPSVRRALKLPDFAAGFEFGPGLVLTHDSSHSSYVQLPRFPKVEQDICLRVPANLAYQTLFDFAQETLAEVEPENTYAALSPLDIYQRDDNKEHKQITFRYSIASYDKTMTDAEVSHMLDHLAAAAQKAYAAERV